MNSKMSKKKNNEIHLFFTKPSPFSGVQRISFSEHWLSDKSLNQVGIKNNNTIGSCRVERRLTRT